MSWWDGKPLGSPLSLDTETRWIGDALDIPDLALAVASDGKKSVLIHPDDLLAFLTMHRKHHKFYLFNASFDFWVMNRHLQGNRLLWDLVNDNRFTCLRLLWRLIKLATTGIPQWRGDLADVATVYGVSVPNKADVYRSRYGELVKLTPAQIDSLPEAEGFKTYAINDAITTYQLIKPMEAEALAIMRKAGYGQTKFYVIRPDAVKLWGHLSVNLQTKADIVLAHLSRQPLLIDLVALDGMRTELEHKMEAEEIELELACPGIWDRYKKTTELKRNPATGRPKRKEKPLMDFLKRIAEDEKFPCIMTDNPDVSKREVSLSAKTWARKTSNPLVQLWNGYEKSKVRYGKMIIPMAEGTVYASYETLKKTGRTSASNHSKLNSVPVQQVPKDNTVRKLFKADPGCKRLTIDYSYLEIRTLAACCVAKYGKSLMAQVVKEHTESVKRGETGKPDPHEWMACLSLSLTPAQYFQLPKKEQKQHRTKAKVANFGLPGGLGIARTVEYASESYGVTLTKEGAKQLKQEWQNAFPEMVEWLGDTTVANLCENLGCTAADIKRKFGKYLWPVREAVQGYFEKDKTVPFIEKLAGLAKVPEIKRMLLDFDCTEESHDELSGRILTGTASVLTGLVRTGVGYCDGANLPFQGLAASGAKEALWRLLYAGYNVKAFIHDEVLVDIPTDQVERVRPSIHRILDAAMESVMGHGVPCMSESKVADTWVKE